VEGGGRAKVDLGSGEDEVEVVDPALAGEREDVLVSGGLEIGQVDRVVDVTEAVEITAIREELRDRFGPLPPEAEGLLAVTELRILGGRVGLETILVRGEQARIRFHRNATPRMMRLTSALDDVQFAADVRQTRPLTIKLRRLGGLSIERGLVRALAAVAEGDNGGK